MIRLTLLAGLVLVATARAELFDGVSGDELPAPPACWCVCPPSPHEQFAQCLLFARLDPELHCLSVCRYFTRQPEPALPGGLAAWQPQAVQNDPCPRPTGAHVRLIIRSRDDYAIDSGCWSP